MSAPIEITTSFATVVPDLPTAWTFVMDHIDRVGPAPSVEIRPTWSRDADPLNPNDDWERHFEVVVSGMVEEGL